MAHSSPLTGAAILRDTLQQDSGAQDVPAAQSVPAQVPRQHQARALCPRLFTPAEGRVGARQGDPHRSTRHHTAVRLELAALLRVYVDTMGSD